MGSGTSQVEGTSGRHVPFSPEPRGCKAPFPRLLPQLRQCGQFPQRAMGDGDVFFGTDGKTHYEVRWNRSWGRVTKNANGSTGWADVLSRSCGGGQTNIRVHRCANNPCTALWVDSKHGYGLPPPIHLQPSDWRPHAVHVSLAAVAAEEAGSAGVEGGGVRRRRRRRRR